jgi:inosine-uridine nucleoside N-ribohydrolase
MRPLWLDTDPGFDDLVTLVMVARSPELRLEGIGVVAGNAPLSTTLDNTLRIAEAFGIEAPIYAGCDRPVVQPQKTAEDVLGKGALGTVGKALPPTTRKADTGHAVLELIEAARRMPGELTLVAIGPLTTVAIAMRLDPTLPKLLREIIWMGGSTERGNDTPAAEFNAYADPEAAQVVFSSGANISMFGLNRQGGGRTRRPTQPGHDGMRVVHSRTRPAQCLGSD